MLIKSAKHAVYAQLHNASMISIYIRGSFPTLHAVAKRLTAEFIQQNNVLEGFLKGPMYNKEFLGSTLLLLQNLKNFLK